MPKKRKGELPSGNIRKKIYDHSELCFDEHGNPVIDPKTGRQKKIKKIHIRYRRNCRRSKSAKSSGHGK